MSGVLLWRTPGASTPIDITLRETGSVSMMSRVIVVVREACCTSTCGASPETVTDSASAPTFMSALMVTVWSAVSATPSRVMLANPVSEKVSL